MEVCDSNPAETDLAVKDWCAARRPKGAPRSRIVLPAGDVVLPVGRQRRREWHTFKPPAPGEGDGKPARAASGRARLCKFVAALGLVCGLLLLGHGIGIPWTDISDTPRPHPALVSRGAPAGAERTPETPPAGSTTAADAGATRALQPEEVMMEKAAGVTEAAEEAVVAEIAPQSPAAGETIRMQATAYTLACGNGDGVTATGTIPRPGIIAVDPRVIPHDTLVYIDDYGYFRAEDTGGVIKGDRIDVFMHSRADALSFGKRAVDVKIIGKFDEPGLVKHFP